MVVSETFGHGYQDDVGEIEEAELDEVGESRLELQSARSTKMGEGNYSVPIDIIQHLSVRSIEIFQPLSKIWHRFLGLASSQEEEERMKSKISEVQVGRTVRKHRREYSEQAPQKKMVEGQDGKRELDKAMQQALNCSDVSFRSYEQERAMRSVLEGIDCFEWKQGQTDPAAVVVVSADVAAESSFLKYAMLLSGKKLLRRVVIDECHLVFTSSDWRPKLAQLRTLRVLTCPMVLLTATLPLVLEEE